MVISLDIGFQFCAFVFKIQMKSNRLNVGIGEKCEDRELFDFLCKRFGLGNSLLNAFHAQVRIHIAFVVNHISYVGILVDSRLRGMQEAPCHQSQSGVGCFLHFFAHKKVVILHHITNGLFS